jgi:hypothetical protein
MSDIQTKFENRLERSLPSNIEVVNNRQYSNTGTIYIQPKDSFRSFLEITYSFQDSYATFTITPTLGISEYRVEGESNKILINAPFEGLDILLKDIVRYVSIKNT